MKLSEFGEQLTSESGIVDLMADLGEALNVNPDILFLGGGNPAHIDEFESIIATQLHDIANDPAALHKLVGIYQSPQGSETFIDALVDYLNNECGWSLTNKNIALSNGSQSAFFILINMLAGSHQEIKQDKPNKGNTVNETKRFLFPLMPEYLGYSDQGISKDNFVGVAPIIDLIGDDLFKYKIDFDALNIDDSIAAMCVSRPTNPTGNMVSDDELTRLSALAKANHIPLIIDCAYGDPFPGVVYQKTHYQWQDSDILVLSLSKLGMPAVRTGIVIANESVIERFVKVNTIMSLANGNLGPELMTRILQQGLLPKITQDILLPFYTRKRDLLMAELRQNLKGVPFKMHQPEGAFFLWVWFENLPISSTELYQRLKKEGVLVMDGSPFFFAIHDDWAHKKQCIRLSYCQNDHVISSAAHIIGQELKSLYAKKDE